MGMWLSEILFLGVVAVLVSLSAPAHGGVFDRWYSGKPAAADKAPAPDTNAASSSFIPAMNVGCVCDDPPAVSCQCGVNIATNFLGTQIAFKPKVKVEFLEEKLAVLMSVMHDDRTLFTREISGKTSIPPVCIPIPQYPLLGVCGGFHDMSCNTEEKSVSFCSVLGINFIAMPLPIYPRIPIGCFKADAKNGIVYTSPKLQMPTKEEMLSLFTNIPQLSGPLSALANLAPGAMPSKEMLEQLYSAPLGTISSLASGVASKQTLDQLSVYFPQLSYLSTAASLIPGGGIPNMETLQQLGSYIPQLSALGSVASLANGMPNKETLEQLSAYIPQLSALSSLASMAPGVGVPNMETLQQLGAYVPSLGGVASYAPTLGTVASYAPSVTKLGSYVPSVSWPFGGSAKSGNKPA